MSEANAKGELGKPIRFLKGVGPKLATIFQDTGIEVVEDLLTFFPRTYQDRRRIIPFAEIRVGEDATAVGQVRKVHLRFVSGRRQMLEVVFADRTGILVGRWFHFRRGYERLFKPGTTAVLTGVVQAYRGAKEIIHPGVEIIDGASAAGATIPDSVHYGRIVPVYSEIGGLSSRKIRSLVRTALDLAGSALESAVPDWLGRELGLVSLSRAVGSCHFPDQGEEPGRLFARRTDAQRRVISEEFFLLCLGLSIRRRSLRKLTGCAFRLDGPRVAKLRPQLDYTLTPAQETAFAEIEADLSEPHPMYRLLQGDVGSGKTIVAFLTSLRAADNGCQTAVMAPTEILAEQHYHTMKSWADKAGIQVELLTGSLSRQERLGGAGRVRDGRAHVAIGTHALIQKEVEFQNLGLVIVDEQHRFGVAQRAELIRKGSHPHVLIMTATPIPRTLAMTIYGDLDVSILDELPPGRKPVETRLITEARRPKMYEFVESEIAKGRQAFIVYPLVDESETLYLKNAVKMAEEFQRNVFPKARVGLIHGRMKANLKDATMRAFRDGRLDILVSTTVIEVGIDVPNATIMVIEHAERFGLSQLHQLRGRVGRGGERSTCILVMGKECGEDAARRLKAMVETQDGFKIAEEDLKIRGPGEFLGLRQSGYPAFNLGNLVSDSEILEHARAWAERVLQKDPTLSAAEHARTRAILLDKWMGRLELGAIG